MENVIATIEQEKIIVIVRGVERENLIPLAEAMYNGGIKLLEVTYSANGAVSDEDTAENIRILSEYFKDKMFIGAGTVLTEKQVELTFKAGGKFIISPDSCKEVIEKTKELGLVSIPGAITPTEMQQAHRFGADFIKIFPITSLGPDYVKAIKAPLSHLKILAVGGVDVDNISTYLKAGVCGFGLGSNIIDKKKIQDKDWEGITTLAKKYIDLVK
ncbi:MAG: bifunctional 4-hydroxy-2-oxoglutarate aldolase/2-dehydro-3-deoxy-phosphogluconate aldolase [Clostridia bacterium]|nr:bifunctional 4-hydroxy-2-oxoglutarate aldolase/2-dehydro-3-deoxy-phosphogluconate aldolase [Clostridia bacterium]